MHTSLDLWSKTATSAQDDVEDEALSDFFIRLEADLILFYVLQIEWLKVKYFSRLGVEFGGVHGSGPPAPTRKAAYLLMRLADFKPKQVKPRTSRGIPIVEGLLTFQRVTYSFLPNQEPALFIPPNRVLTYKELLKQNRPPRAAINYILRRLRSA